MLRIALRADVHAALQQALFQHRVHVHERLDRDALDALPEEPAHPVALPQQGAPRESQQRAQAEVAVLADVAEQIGDRRVGQGGALAQQPERSEEHTSELQSPCNLVCRLLLEKKKKRKSHTLPITIRSYRSKRMT